MRATGTINKVILIGEISHKPHWCQMEGSTVLCFKLTTWQGEHSEVHAVRLQVHNQEQELKLGALVHIEGRIKTTVFVDESQIRRYKTEIVVARLTHLSRP